MINSRVDVVGSLLRPPELMRAREQLSGGTLGSRQFKEIEDRAVDDAIALQESLGLEVVTDGELRRQSFQSQMVEAVSGFGDFELDAFLWGKWYDDKGIHQVPRPATVGVVDKLVRKRHLSIDEFVYLRARTSRIPKITLPSAGLWVNFWSKDRSQQAYSSLDAFLGDVVKILRDEVGGLIRAGATYIQIDAPHFGLLLDLKTRKFYEDQGWSLSQWLSLGIDLDNAVMEGFPEVTFALHI
jgi:5-methyltetrahydropteroyltriglutamate--homocysteine methyltransferase